jgi:phage gpG-like protein
MISQAHTTYTVEEFAAICKKAATMTFSAMPDCAEEVKRIVRQAVSENFAMQQTADGIGWPQRKKPGDGHSLLQDTLALRDAATGEGEGKVERIVDGCELQLGVEKIDLGGLLGAGVHQFGYPEKNIPRREYLAVSDATVDELVETIADHLVSGLF